MKLYISDSSSVHHQEFIHCTLSSGICHTAFEQDQDGTAVPSWSYSKAVYKPVWHIPLLSVLWINSWWWTDELSETCRVSCQNKFVKLVHLFGFIIKRCSVSFFSWGRRTLGIVVSRRWDWRLWNLSSVPDKGSDLSLPHNAQAGSGARRASRPHFHLVRRSRMRGSVTSRFGA